MRFSDLVVQRVWTYRVQEDSASGAGGGPGTIDPYTDPGGGPGIGLPADWQVFPTPTNPAPSYPTGPPSQRNYYHASNTASPPPPPDPWAGISSAVHSQATQTVDQFESLIGGAAPGFDLAGVALALAKSGMNITGGKLDGWQWLYDTQLTLDQKKANPWAQFGLDKDSYNTVVKKMDSSYFNWTGEQMSTQNLGAQGLFWQGSPMWQAIRENWTPDQIQNYAIYGNSTGSGTPLASAQFSGSMPWLSAGQTYSQTLQQFESFGQTTPTDKATLAAFWRFGASAKQIGAGQEAVATAKPVQGSMAEVR